MWEEDLYTQLGALEELSLLKTTQNGSGFDLYFATIHCFCNFSYCLVARNKVEYFFKISLNRAFGIIPWFENPRYDQKLCVGLF